MHVQQWELKKLTGSGFFTDFEVISSYRNFFGPSWKGRFLAGVRKSDPMFSWNDLYPERPHRLKQTLFANPQWGVDYQDESVSLVRMSS